MKHENNTIIRKLLLLFVLASIPLCIHAQKVINTESFNDADTVVVGRMGVPLGKIVEIEAIVVSGDSLRLKGYAGKYLLKVISVGTNGLLNMPVYEFEGGAGMFTSDSAGRGFTLLVYETGSFSGMPQGMPNDYPLIQSRGFGFSPCLQVVRVLKEWTVTEERAKELQEKEKRNAEMERAFQIMNSADVVVEYESPSRIFLRPHGGKNSACVAHDQMSTTIAGATDKREMAVVIMGKPMRMHSDETFRKEVDEIERLIKAQGFKRVVFMLASAFGMPIYRE